MPNSPANKFPLYEFRQRLPHNFWVYVIPLFIGCLFLFFYVQGLMAVPFHPDESTYLYMSRDYDIFFIRQSFAELAWLPDTEISGEMRYRLLDPPLTRYLAGFSWWMQGFTIPDLNSDWVWGASWEANSAAIPTPKLLFATRLIFAILSASTVTLVFWYGIRLGGWSMGILAALFVGLDPLLLLHARRVMSESPMIFFNALAVFGVVFFVCEQEKQLQRYSAFLSSALMVGGLIGLAFASKQTGIVIFPITCAAFIWTIVESQYSRRDKFKRLILSLSGLSLGTGVVFLALSPVLWASPLSGILEMFSLRQTLTQTLIEINGAANPNIVLADVSTRVVAMVDQVFWQKPAISDTAVYLEQLGLATETYYANPSNVFLRYGPFPLLISGFTGIGVVIGIYYLRRPRPWCNRGALQATLLWLVFTIVLLAIVVPLNWQRYFLPLLVPTRLFAALGVHVLIHKIMTHFKLMHHNIFAKPA